MSVVGVEVVEVAPFARDREGATAVGVVAQERARERPRQLFPRTFTSTSQLSRDSGGSIEVLIGLVDRDRAYRALRAEHSRPTVSCGPFCKVAHGLGHVSTLEGAQLFRCPIELLPGPPRCIRPHLGA